MEKILKIITDTIKGTLFENKTYIVGGYVRDHVMGKTSKDMDIVVELENGGNELARFLYEKGVSSKPLFFTRFGTAIVGINNHQVEFVMTRKEEYQEHSRKPDVEVGSLKDDVYRRDFTINSLIMNIVTGEISDITGKGISDIENKIIRSTSDPEIIFGEDPLRMLRAVRFAVQLDFKIEQETETGIKENADKLEFISWERRRDELSKMLLSNQPSKAVQMLIDFVLMKNLIPEIYEIIDLENKKPDDLDVFTHTLKVLDAVQPQSNLRLAALLHDIAKKQVRIKTDTGFEFPDHEPQSALIAKAILKRLKFSNNLTRDVALLIRNHARLNYLGKDLELLNTKFIMKLVSELGNKLDLLLEFIHIDKNCHKTEYNKPDFIPEIKKRIDKIKNEFKERTMPVAGKDIMDYFKMSPGKKIGEILKMAENIWYEHPDWSKKEILNKIELEKNN